MSYCLSVHRQMRASDASAAGDRPSFSLPLGECQLALISSIRQRQMRQDCWITKGLTFPPPRTRVRACTNAAVGVTGLSTPPLILLIYVQWQIWLSSLGRVALMHQRDVPGWVAVGAALSRYPSNPYIAWLCI